MRIPTLFICSSSAYIRVELDMETPRLLECFALSRQKNGQPRPFRLMRPFRQIRCYPETVPRQRQCTYGSGQEFIQTLGAALLVFSLRFQSYFYRLKTLLLTLLPVQIWISY
ncbi:hypothetical protein GOODEAATRI_013404 [Goodea atripinnis]|uniref:Uncharacterized protein n=1 Tax=Goodea atripinnis TaxID=208336 RepID=A0ABV0PXN6_9TELE